jgi:hypothetical protein
MQFFPCQKFLTRGVFKHLLAKGSPVWWTSITNRKIGNDGL